jgi:7-dehydrocholesterol reductase
VVDGVQDPRGTALNMVQVPDTTTWTILLSYFVVQFLIMVLVPGKTFYGPLSPMGNRPSYKAHGLQCFAVSLLLYATLYAHGVFTATLIYEQLGKMYTALVIVAFAFCAFLWAKGHVAPTYAARAPTHPPTHTPRPLR